MGCVQRTGGWIKHWMQDLIGAGLAITVGLGALAGPFGLWFEGWSYDLPYRLRPDLAAGAAAVVSMDAAYQAALAQTDTDEWSRELHANLLDRLLARGARVVVFTTVFSKPSPTNSTDRVFAQALRRARGKVVLAAASTNESTNGAVLKPVPELAAAAPWGLLASRSGKDGVVRRLGSPSGHPTLAARVAQLIIKPSTNTFSSRWMAYYAPNLGLPEVSYEQVLRGAEPPGVFKGKIVLVSPTSADSDLLPTPYTHWPGRRATRAEVEATAILNLTRREWLSRLPPAIESGVLVVAGGFLGLVFMGMRRRAALLLASGAILLVATGAYLVFAKLHFWFPWLVVAGAQIPVAFSWAWLCDAVDRPRIPRASPSSPAPTLAPASPSGPAPPPTSQQGAHAAAIPDLPTIPDHSLIKCIGRGAYGEVWLVRDVIGRHHAVKIVKARNFPHPAPYEREFKGIERFASISRTHPGLVQVLHIGRHDAGGYFFYIMELADDANGAMPLEPNRYSAKTLASELARRGHLPVRESVQIGLALCSALQHLHERQLVHRDIKPTNIIFVEGAPKIADIGLVTQLGSDTADMTRLGTEGYLAPEGPGTPSADLYALGKVLYEISMGRDRWQFPEFPTTLATRPDQDSLRQLHEVILTACETDPAHRYQSAIEMHAALERLQGP
jgi:CHASE2 domain-containing sensor protein